MISPLPHQPGSSGTESSLTLFNGSAGAAPPVSDEQRTTLLLQSLCYSEALRWRFMTSLRDSRPETLLDRAWASVRKVLSHI